MKIGILTLPLHTNYGGILQNYALQYILQEMGHSTITINYNHIVRLPVITRYPIYFKNILQRYLLKKNVVVFPDIEANKPWLNRTRHTADFVNKYIKHTDIKRIDELKPKDFNCMIVGSDQIWRRLYNQSFPGITNSFLEFAKDWNVKRITYAASFGTDNWEYTEEETKKCAELIQKFDAVSVREKSAVKLCKEKFNINAVHLLDPTMLLTANNYKKLFEAANTPASPGNLMCYILDANNDTDNIIHRTATIKGLYPFYTNSRTEDNTAPLEERVQPPVENWLRGFYDASFVVTDSFHACVFSILFNKPFIVYGNKERGMARFTSLLEMFGLEERLISNEKELKYLIDKEIDWEVVNCKLDALREHSFEFLNKTLG